MKKTIKALLGGLVLSIVLLTLFPSDFLKDDAKWTYQSDVGRVDVAFVGDVQDGCLEVRGDNVRAYEPKWLLDSRHNQGTMISFPVSYLKRTYEIALEPQGKAKEMSLTVIFRGDNLMVDGKRKPAYVRFENVQFDGKPIAQETDVWHDKPFIYKKENVKVGQNLTLTFNIQKPFSLTDIAWERVIGLFMACSLLISCSNILRRLVNGLNKEGKKDIVQIIAENYRNVDVVYRRAFWIIFGALCFAFGFHAIQFMWGNHDWAMLIHSQGWDTGIDIGRYALNFFKKIFLGGVYLPLIYDIVSFLFLALNAVLLCIYWRLEKQVIYFALCGLILTVQPFTLSMMYYVHMLPEVFIGVTSALIALMLGEKIAFEKSSLVKKVVFPLLSIVLINLSMATYPVLLNTVAVAFVGSLLIRSFEWEGSWKQFKSHLISFSIPAICIALGIGLYKFMITFVFPVKELYNTQTLPLEQLPERLFVLFKHSFHQLYEYNFPFISQGVLWIFLCFTILIVLYICLTGNFKQKIVRLLLLGGAFFATQAAMMIANKHIIAARVELFGLVVFETLVTVIVFTKLKKLHNLSVLAATGVIWISIVNDLDCLRVWKLGFDAEKMLWNRVLARMERQTDFNIRRKYAVVQIGWISLRPRFYEQSYPLEGFHDNAESLLSYTFDCHWSAFSAHAFYYQTDFRGTHLRFNRPNDPKYKAQLKRLWEAGVLDKAQAWPHENGLIVWEDVILFVTDAKLLEEYKKQLAKEFPRQPKLKP